jgi:hypothetical protein
MSTKDGRSARIPCHPGPQAYLADIFARLVEGHPINRLDELVPWNGPRLTKPEGPRNIAYVANGRADALASRALMNKNPPLFGCNG